MPEISIIIGVYNDWDIIGDCLKSLSEQNISPIFEVVIVDDGSQEKAPEAVRAWNSYYSIKFVRQAHSGLPVARNRGIQVARAEVLVFVDCDCVLHTDCLKSLTRVMALHPLDDCFQLRLVGDCSHLVGRAEELHLSTIQQHLLVPNSGSVRYLNTAGVAIRSRLFNKSRGLFDPRAIRAQDTLLLAELIQRGNLPRFVPEAVVLHAVKLKLSEYLGKSIRTGYLEGSAYGIIASKGVSVRSNFKERGKILMAVWTNARSRSLGMGAFVVVMVRQTFRLMSSMAYRLLHPHMRP